MKIRQGFVSNSSSSSFTLFVKKSAYDQAVKQLSGPTLACVELCAEQKTMGNDAFMLIHEYSDTGGEGTLTWAAQARNFTDDEEEEFYGGLYALETILKKQFPGTFIKHSI